MLSGRLQRVADFVTPGLNVADIGCDHGYTAIYLVNERIAPKVYAMDINRGPLEKARQNIERAGLADKIILRLSDGLDKLGVSEAECIVISGMGGLLMKQILEKKEQVCQAADELVLQPQSETGSLRHYLHDAGFRISREEIIFDAGKYYNIMKAVHGRECYASEAEYRYGKRLLAEGAEVFCSCLRRECARMERIAESLMCKAGEKAAKRRRELCGEIQFIREYLRQHDGGETREMP